MRNRKFLTAVASLVAALFPLAAPLAYAGQDIVSVPVLDLKPVGRGYGTVSTNKLGILKYIGPQACASVAVGAGGDITFLSGTCGALVADTTLECPVSGALGGVFDLSTPAAGCDTWGEVTDLINASGSWMFIPIGVLRSDATDNVAITLSETQNVMAAKGVALLKDDTVALNVTIQLGGSDDDIQTYTKQQGASHNHTFNVNNWANTSTRVIDVVGTVTTAGAATVAIICSKSTFAPQTGAWTETARTIFSQAGGASTVEFTKTYPYLECDPGEKLLVRESATSTLTAATVFAAGSTRQSK